MAIGFPAVLIFAWVYEITPEGLKPTAEVPHSESISRLTGRKLASDGQSACEPMAFG